MRNGPLLFGGGSLQMRNGPFLIRESETQMRDELFLIGGRPLQIRNSSSYCAGTRLRIGVAPVRLRASPRRRYFPWAKNYEKSPQNVYFLTLLAGLMFREDFFNTQMNG